MRALKLKAVGGLLLGTALLTAAAWARYPLWEKCLVEPAAIIGDSNVLRMRLGPGCQNLGVGGDTSQMMAARLRPSQIIFKTLIIWGTANDAHAGKTYGVRYYRQMVRQARTAGLRVILTTPVPVRSAEPMARSEAVAVQIRQLGALEGIPVADVRRTVSLPDGGPNPALYAPEGSHGQILEHLNRAGQLAAWRVIQASL